MSGTASPSRAVRGRPKTLSAFETPRGKHSQIHFVSAMAAPVSKADKILEKIMAGGSDANIRFDDMCFLLLKLGFIKRQSGGSHVIFPARHPIHQLAKQGGYTKEY